MEDEMQKKSRKDRIIDAALHKFSQKDFQEVTISEISKEAGVSEATIYEYFGTKENLIFAIPKILSDFTFEKSEAIFPLIKDVEGKIRVVVWHYIQQYQNNPDYTAVLLLKLMSNQRFRKTEAHAAIRRGSRRLLDLIREGIADGTFREDTDAYLIRSILMGTVEHIFIHWHMEGMPKREKSMMDMLDPLLEIVLGSIRTKKEDIGFIVHVGLKDINRLGLLLQSEPILKCQSMKSKGTGTKSSNKT